MGHNSSAMDCLFWDTFYGEHFQMGHFCLSQIQSISEIGTSHYNSLTPIPTT